MMPSSLVAKLPGSKMTGNRDFYHILIDKSTAQVNYHATKSKQITKLF